MILTFHMPSLAGWQTRDNSLAINYSSVMTHNLWDTPRDEYLY